MEAPAPAAPAPTDDGTAYKPLVEEEGTLPSTEMQTSEAFWKTPAIFGAEKTWRAHFGTDMQQGCWWMLFGCALFVAVMVPIVAQDTSRVDKWLELLAAFIFLAGCWYLLEASYPASMMAVFERLATPPKPNRTLFERYVTSSAMMFSTQLFNLGMLPYLVEGALNMASPPADDPEGAALSLFVGTLLCMPLLLLFSATATDEAMRTAFTGQGTSYSWDRCVGPIVRALGGTTEYWQRHCGTDNLFVMWLFFVLMAVSCPFLLPMWIMDPSDEQHLCGVSMSCGASLLVTVPFTIGAGLMVRAAYPENAGKPTLLGLWLRQTGQWLIEGAEQLEPDPALAMQMSTMMEAPTA